MTDVVHSSKTVMRAKSFVKIGGCILVVHVRGIRKPDVVVLGQGVVFLFQSWA